MCYFSLILFSFLVYSTLWVAIKIGEKELCPRGLTTHFFIGMYDSCNNNRLWVPDSRYFLCVCVSVCVRRRITVLLLARQLFHPNQSLTSPIHKGGSKDLLCENGLSTELGARFSWFIVCVQDYTSLTSIILEETDRQTDKRMMCITEMVIFTQLCVSSLCCFYLSILTSLVKHGEFCMVGIRTLDWRHRSLLVVEFPQNGVIPFSRPSQFALYSYWEKSWSVFQIIQKACWTLSTMVVMEVGGADGNICNSLLEEQEEVHI